MLLSPAPTSAEHATENLFWPSSSSIQLKKPDFFWTPETDQSQGEGIGCIFLCPEAKAKRHNTNLKNLILD